MRGRRLILPRPILPPQEKGNVENFPRGCTWGRRPLHVWGQSFYLHPCVTLNLHRKRCGSVDGECHGLAWGCSWPNSQHVLVPPWGQPEPQVTLCRRSCWCLACDWAHWQPFLPALPQSCDLHAVSASVCVLTGFLFRMISKRYLGQKWFTLSKKMSAHCTNCTQCLLSRQVRQTQLNSTDV